SVTRSLLGRQVLKKTIGGNYVRNQEVINLQQKFLSENPAERAPHIGMTALEDIREALEFLSREDLLTRRTKIQDHDVELDGFVFADRENIVTLRQRGYLTLFDSTYGTNSHNYALFTFMVRDGHGIFLTCPHAILQSE
ncbi:hypothetical protein POJ06DRAFT_201731, partial [Lipomyces tetrasporus]